VVIRYASTTRRSLRAIGAAAVAATWLITSSTAHARDPAPGQRRPGELWLGLGIGNAVCDNEQPDSQCPVDGAGTFDLGGAYRFHPHWAVGAELAVWGFKVRDEWRGQLDNQATDVELSSFYLAPLVRWYWFDHGRVDAYLQGGIGVGSVQAKAENEGSKYEARASGLVYPLGIGAEWYVSKHFRLGPQALAYLHVSSEVCENNNGDETCRDGTKDDNALPWRLMLMGTFVLGNGR
jgi:hypothetical protein